MWIQRTSAGLQRSPEMEALNTQTLISSLPYENGQGCLAWMPALAVRNKNAVV